MYASLTWLCRIMVVRPEKQLSSIAVPRPILLCSLYPNMFFRVERLFGYVYLQKSNSSWLPTTISFISALWPLWGHRHIDDLPLYKKRGVSNGDRPEMTVIYRDAQGVKRCKGGRDLKKSQHYPKQLPRLSLGNTLPFDDFCLTNFARNEIAYSKIPPLKCGLFVQSPVEALTNSNLDTLNYEGCIWEFKAGTWGFQVWGNDQS